MSWIIELALSNAGWIGGILAILAALFGFGWKKKREGRKEAIQEMEEETDKMVEKADQITRKYDGMTDEEVETEVDKWRR